MSQFLKNNQYCSSFNFKISVPGNNNCTRFSLQNLKSKGKMLLMYSIVNERGKVEIIIVKITLSLKKTKYLICKIRELGVD